MKFQNYLSFLPFSFLFQVFYTYKLKTKRARGNILQIVEIYLTDKYAVY